MSLSRATTLGSIICTSTSLSFGRDYAGIERVSLEPFDSGGAKIVCVAVNHVVLTRVGILPFGRPIGLATRQVIHPTTSLYSIFSTPLCASPNPNIIIVHHGLC